MLNGFNQRIVYLLAVLLLPAFLLPGCSTIELELNNRGGWVDAKLDNHWWVADTKPMRVLRAYVLVGSVARMAQTKYASEREAIIQRINSAVAVASDVFYCGYAQPGKCVYFDERMSELEFTILQLLAAVVSSKDDDELFKALGKELTHTFPLFKGVESFASLVTAITKSAEFLTATSKAIEAVFQITESAYFKGRRLGALYRDSIELQMLTVLSSLDTMCAVRTGQYRHYVYNEKVPHEQRYSVVFDEWESRKHTIENFYGAAWEMPDGVCQEFRKGYFLWSRGAGDLADWKTYLDRVGTVYRKHLIPTEEPFVQASDLIWRACQHITQDPQELSDCIGRRRQKDKTPVAECALDFDRAPDDAKKKAEIIKKEAVAAAVQPAAGVSTPWKDQCRLILYAKVIERRQEGVLRSGAMARIYWLSDLTPSPSHSLNRHPEQCVLPNCRTE